MSAPSINIWQVIGKLAEAVLADAAFMAAVEQAYGTLTVFLGVDWSNQPGENDAPYLAFSPAADDLGDFNEEFSFVVHVMFGIKDKARATAGNVVTQDGQQALAEILSPLLEAALRRFSENASIASMQGEYFFEAPPLLERDLTLTITVPQLQGAAVEL